MGILPFRIPRPAVAGCVAGMLAGGCAGPAAGRRSAPPGPPPIAARISPDGRRVTYVEDAGSGARIVTVDIDSGRVVTVAPPPKTWAALNFPPPPPAANRASLRALVASEAPHRQLRILGVDAGGGRILFTASGASGPPRYFVYDQTTGILYEAGRAVAAR